VVGGGTLVVSCFSGIVDADDAVHEGGHPGAFREVLGLAVDEFLPLRSGERIGLADGSAAGLWAEAVVPAGADVVLTYVDGLAAGGPAVTRHRLGRGRAWYVSTVPDDLDVVLTRVYEDAGLAAPRLPDGVEVMRRVGDGSSYLVVINHGDGDAEVPVVGWDVLDDRAVGPTLLVRGGDVRGGDVRVVRCREGD
jgi:beta-galactosidase